MDIKTDIGVAATSKAITSLDLSCLDQGDLVNLILQRSEVMFDKPKSGRIIKAWNDGDVAPITAVAQEMGLEIAQRAAGVIYAEFRAMEKLLKDLKPKRIADIGCGYAFFDLFAAKSLKAEVLLIDLEENEHRHFGFKPEGAAYSSLAKARKLLEDNGVSTSRIETLNPKQTAPETAAPVDLAVSFLSCGFHYPVDLYLPFLEQVLKPGGTAIFDLRERTADEQAQKLCRLGTLTDLDAPPKARRVMLRKAAA